MKLGTWWSCSWGILLWGIVVWLVWGKTAHAIDYLVATDAQLTTALNNAAQGDHILLEPGIYSGGRYRLGLTGVTIRSSDPGNRAVIRGGVNGIQLSSPQSVTLEDLIFEQQTVNGINIDDNGNIATPASDITLRRVTFRDVGSTGNHDGVKLSGVRDFLLDSIEVFDWGEGGSAVDMVGSHRGLIQNSYFRDTDTNAASGIRPKGGSKDITIRANRIELPSGVGRAIQAGGSTGSQFFRFIDGDSGYEADSIIAEGNVVLGGASSFSFVNIDGGLFHHNYAERPDRWNVRILNENQGNAIVDTQNGTVRDNVLVFNDTPSEYSQAVNIGPETLPQSFTFSNNQWYNLANPTAAGSMPQLPVTEIGGIYGVDPEINSAGVIAWEFDWGTWLVNASPQSGSFSIDEPGEFALAQMVANGEFTPSVADPFIGSWQYMPLASGELQLEPFSQLILRLDSTLPRADANGDGLVVGEDFLAWQDGFSSFSPGLAEGDFNWDGSVDGADLGLWEMQYGSVSVTGSQASVPEPTGTLLLVLGLLVLTSDDQLRTSRLSSFAKHYGLPGPQKPFTKI